MFVGTMVHELLQECLRRKAHTAAQVEALANAALASGSVVKELLALDMTQEDMRLEIQPFLPHILFFTEK